MNNLAQLNMELIISIIAIGHFIIAVAITTLTFIFHSYITRYHRKFLYIMITSIILAGVGNITKLYILNQNYQYISVFLDMFSSVVMGLISLILVYLSFKFIKIYLYNKNIFTDRIKDISAIINALQYISENKPK